jgi:flagellar motor switch protein FliM
MLHSPASRQLSQEEIDVVFHDQHPDAGSPAADVQRYDFLRKDRIPTSQLRAIRLLHENFARSLASSLSAYLRSYVAVNLVSFEQLSYAEFVEGLRSPTIVVGLNLHPYEGAGVMEVGPSLFFPVLEMLLGGTGQNPKPIKREITDIEQRLIEMLLRVIVQDLKESWKTVAPIDFTVQTIEKEPQFLQVVAPREAVIAIGMEVSVGRSSGPLNLAIPALVIKMMRNRFDQQWTLRRVESSPADQKRMLRLLEPADSQIQVCLRGATMPLGDLMRLEPGDLLTTDLPVNRPLDCLVNGTERFHGHLAQVGKKAVFQIDGVNRDA